MPLVAAAIANIPLARAYTALVAVGVIIAGIAGGIVCGPLVYWTVRWGAGHSM